MLRACFIKVGSKKYSPIFSMLLFALLKTFNGKVKIKLIKVTNNPVTAVLTLLEISKGRSCLFLENSSFLAFQNIILVWCSFLLFEYSFQCTLSLFNSFLNFLPSVLLKIYYSTYYHQQNSIYTN